MLKVFNHFRKDAIKKHRVVKYLIYAIGEIILVVIGIYIGLQANKWNEAETKKAKIEAYYIRIHEEAQYISKQLEYNSSVSRRYVSGLEYSLKAISNNIIDSTVIATLAELTDADAQMLYIPVIDEFLNQDYLASIENEKLRKHFQMLDYQRQRSKIDDDHFLDFNRNILKPKLINRFNYLDIDIMNFDSELFNLKRLELSNDYENDYSKLLNDLELWNILVYKLSLEKDRITINKSLMHVFDKISKETK